jgi:hypothetical protein
MFKPPSVREEASRELPGRRIDALHAPVLDGGFAGSGVQPMKNSGVLCSSPADRRKKAGARRVLPLLHAHRHDRRHDAHRGGADERPCRPRRARRNRHRATQHRVDRRAPGQLRARGHGVEGLPRPQSAGICYFECRFHRVSGSTSPTVHIRPDKV